MMKLADLKQISFPEVSPSLLAANKANIPAEVALIEDSCSFVHIDIMDGKFVSNISFYKEFPGSFSTSLHKDTHLMVIDPLNWINEAIEGGSSIVTFHLEAYNDETKTLDTIAKIHYLGALAGLSIKPLTPVDSLTPYLPFVDVILVMSVEPGKGGQSYIDESDARIASIKKMISSFPLDKRPIIEVDGGINRETGKRAIEAGADLLVAGSYLFGHSDIKERIKGLKNG